MRSPQPARHTPNPSTREGEYVQVRQAKPSIAWFGETREMRFAPPVGYPDARVGPRAFYGLERRATAAQWAMSLTGLWRSYRRNQPIRSRGETNG